MQRKSQALKGNTKRAASKSAPHRAAPPRGLAPNDSLDLAALAARYAEGSLTPTQLVDGVLARIAQRGDDKVWIHRLPEAELRAKARALEAGGREGKPLWGIPFAIKDNIDLAGHPTTAACPDYRYVAKESATVVAKLIDAGAIPIGKTNLDQFATGLNGTRSPYGAPGSALDAAYISGGSSSGSAVAVAAGLCTFSLGTDTAGSGRVPAMLNNIVGLKPTRGLLSAKGVVPACQSLDCVSIFALTADDARDVLAVARGFDPRDVFSRKPARSTLAASLRGLRVGVPRPGQLEFCGNDEGARRFKAMRDLVARLGGMIVEFDVAPYLETARLLYEGPWVAERYVAIKDFIQSHADSLHPVTRQIIGGGAKPSAADAFAAYYRLKAMRRRTSTDWQTMDVMLLPTAPRTYTIAEMQADPIRLNSNLGLYTNFVNMLDLSAFAVPAGMQSDGLPFGVTLLAPAWSDEALCALADELHRAQPKLKLGALATKLPPARKAASGGTATIRIAVCGAHMKGLPLNHQITERGGWLVREARTAPAYRFYALPGGPPERPGLVREKRGKAIAVEVWEMPDAEFGSFMRGIPAPLTIGTVELEDGERVKGFLCEASGTAGAKDISALGGWRKYLATRKDRGKPKSR